MIAKANYEHWMSFHPLKILWKKIWRDQLKYLETFLMLKKITRWRNNPLESQKYTKVFKKLYEFFIDATAILANHRFLFTY